MNVKPSQHIFIFLASLLIITILTSFAAEKLKFYYVVMNSSKVNELRTAGVINDTDGGNKRHKYNVTAYYFKLKSLC